MYLTYDIGQLVAFQRLVTEHFGDYMVWQFILSFPSCLCKSVFFQSAIRSHWLKSFTATLTFFFLETELNHDLKTLKKGLKYLRVMFQVIVGYQGYIVVLILSNCILFHFWLF